MKICPKCGNALSDDAAFCTLCGAKMAGMAETPQLETPQSEIPQSEAPQSEIPQPEAPQPEAAQQETYQQAPYQQYQQAPYQQPVYTQPAYDPADHTSEFDAKDISDNKVVAMLPYLMSAVGIVIAALIGGTSSPYTMFHIRQALKFMVVGILVGIVSAVLCWTVIVPIAAGIFMMVLFVIRVICFVQVCKGQAKEPAIIRSIGFLK